LRDHSLDCRKLEVTFKVSKLAEDTHMST